MEMTQKLAYDDFILLNDHLSFHPGGLIATFNLLSHIANKSHDQTILDFGCGNGITISFLKKLGYKKLIGYDRNPNAIELCQKKFGEFKFFKDLDLMLQDIDSIDLLLLESVFNFNDQAETDELLKAIQSLIQKTNIKQVGIVDFYSVGNTPVDLIEKMKTTFGIREVKNKKEFEEIVAALGPNNKVTYFNEHSFFMNLSDKYHPSEQATKLMSNKLLLNNFTSEKEAQQFFNEFIGDMLSAYGSFTNNFKYFECVVTL